MQQSIAFKVFKNFDIFGQNIQLNFNGDDSYQTATGGIFSITIIAVIAFFFQQNIVDFLSKNYVNLDVQTLFDANPDDILFNDDNYMFALAIEQSKFNTNPYFNITLKQRIYTRLNNGTTIKQDSFIDLIPCTIDRFQNIFNNQNFTDQFISLGLSEWLCPQYNYSIRLSGGYTSQLFQFTKVTVSECSNNTDNNEILTWKPKCASSSERDAHLNNDRSFRIKMYMTNTIINPLQPKNISQVFLDDELFFSFILQTGTETDVFYQKYNVTTNQNIFPYIEDNQEQLFNIKQQGDFRVNNVQNSGSSYSAIYMRRSPYTYQVKRDFQDLADLLSYLGGFANIVVMIFGFFISFYNKSQFMIELANQVYDFPIKNINNIDTQQRKEIKKTIARAKSRTIILKPNTQNSQLQSPKYNQNQQFINNDTPKQDDQCVTKQDEQHTFQQEQEKIIQQLGITNRKSYLTQQIEKILNRSRPIFFNCRYILYQLFCQRFFYDRNSILLQKAIKNINQDLDLCVIIDKVKEINLLKELLLTEDQLVLFDFAPKEVINLEEDKKQTTRSLARNTLRNFHQISSILNTKDEQNKSNQSINTYYKLFQAYDRMHQALQQNDKINEKLIGKLGQEVRDIFEVSQFIQWENNRKMNSEPLDDEFQCDSVNSDPPCITSLDQFKVNFKLNS
ncbi:unnamed protein product (macronuclear) [Paramecium tetraurelia]|uniref:Transmembrane protein n=1 Tax=Paramecium tetraurelia TaxID=5888 RepID=A0CZ90_PARTE|nr:uncharacterized protein GSPATT00011680001 [Paramecium tetraurelia]CAK76107.1 unnamed protein product [Paramecium tetraurelia]|eukprot:XP_001443504.1 hypothetical protein (macronuclear) [Paramecium tetraurelia strain d4-2]